MDEYEETQQFWNHIFADEEKEFDIREPIRIDEIEESLKWLSEESESIIDYGCGNGSLLLRCSYLVDAESVGIDISEEAVKSSRNRAKQNGVDKRSKFIFGGVEELSQFEDDRFDAAILSNVLDNMLPDDAERLLSEFNRILKRDGKIVIKLNDYIEPEKLTEWGSKEISEGFYKEDTGLYFWNLTDDEVEELLSEHFKIENRIDVEFKEHDQINRLYYIRNHI